jgi:hypothetical protein
MFWFAVAVESLLQVQEGIELARTEAAYREAMSRPPQQPCTFFVDDEDEGEEDEDDGFLSFD